MAARRIALVLASSVIAATLGSFVSAPAALASCVPGVPTSQPGVKVAPICTQDPPRPKCLAWNKKHWYQKKATCKTWA
jgi:hypothetical protein